MGLRVVARATPATHEGEKVVPLAKS
jgi:hypothetical protein